MRTCVFANGCTCTHVYASACVRTSVCVDVSCADRLAEDHVSSVLQGEVHGDGRSTVLHQQEHHGALSLVTHHSHTLGQRGEERVQGLAPLPWARHTVTKTVTHTHT